MQKSGQDRCKQHGKDFKPTESNMSGFSQRTRSLEVSERLTGSLAFQMPNRHRHCKGMTCQHTGAKVDENHEQQVSVIEAEAQEGNQAETPALRFRDDKIDSKDPEPCVAKEKSKGGNKHSGIVSPNNHCNTDNCHNTSACPRCSKHETTKHHENHDTRQVTEKQFVHR